MKCLKLKCLLLFALALCVLTGCGPPRANIGGGDDKVTEGEVVGLIGHLTNYSVREINEVLERKPKLAVAKAPGGRPPLLMAASSRGDQNMVSLLLRYGAGVNVNDTDGSHETALIFASRKGFKPIVVMLLNENADVNVKNDKGETALKAAEKAGKTDVVEVLRQHGAKE